MKKECFVSHNALIITHSPFLLMLLLLERSLPLSYRAIGDSCLGGLSMCAPHLFISRNRDLGKITELHRQTGTCPNQRKPSRKPASEHQLLLSVKICSQHDVENHSACSVSAAGWSTGTGRPLVRSQIMRPGVHPRCHLHLRRLSMEALLDKHRLVLQTLQSRFCKTFFFF